MDLVTVSAVEEALGNILIVESLLSFCSLNTLKNLRRVSSFFNNEALKEMYRKYYLNLASRHLAEDINKRGGSYGGRKFRRDEELGEFLSKSVANHVKFRNIKISGKFRTILPHLDIYGHHVRRLINKVNYDSLMPEFCNRLGQFPNLKDLTLSYLCVKPTDWMWDPLYRFFGQLEKVAITGTRMQPEALKHFIKSKNQAPACIQKFFPGLCNWSSEVGNGYVPRGSLIAGRDNEIGHNLIVARSWHPRGDLLPGKLVAAHGICYAPWAGEAHNLERCETLILREDEVQWVTASAGEVVPGAIVGGMTDYGEILYIGRVLHEGSVHLGKVHRSHGVLYIAYHGQEIAHTNYDTLVLKSAVSN